jgi:RimJ/RimL family protein N-acetyltransferase
VEDSILERIARYVARIINHGSTLQIGHGNIPNALLKFFGDRRDLGIHSDVITDSIIDLIEKGIINGKAKTLHTGRVVASYCLGSKKLYDLIDNNPMFAFYPMEVVCDPLVLRQNSKLVSITQAEAVDLMGQVCSDQFEGRFYGGVGTQPDFMRGAAASPDGRPIICLASTTEDGKVSRIRPLLNEGEGVTIPRSDVHYVVTECGIAYLFGKSIQEKALALIETAHPSFRPWLLEEARRLKYIRPDQELKCEVKNGHECFYPQTEDREIQLNDTTKIVVRPTRASDVRGLQDLFYKLPPQDVYTRFFTGLKRFSISKAEYFCNVDYERQMAFVVTIGEREQEKIIASSFYLLNQSTRMADVAYMILHEWHGKGLGTILQQRMAEYASSRGVKGFKADILPENRAMLRLAEKCSSRVTKKLCRDVYEVEMLFS